MKYTYYLMSLLVLFIFMTACEKNEESNVILQNDCIKRSLGPNLVGMDIEFAYAMALPQTDGKIVSAQVIATIAGAPGTYLENRSFYTSSNGSDVGIVVGSPSVTVDNTTTVTFTRDTCAATLRYYYMIPEAARGQSVSFTFSVTASNGETVSYEMGPYTVAKMDYVLNLPVSDNNLCYISIADMKVYNNKADTVDNKDKIDLVYAFRNLSHTLAAPAADTAYLRGIKLPLGVNKNAKILKAWNLRDHNLEPNKTPSVYIDDKDFEVIDLTVAPNYAVGLKSEAGAWVETSDGKYRAYIYINSATDASKSMTISIKRLAVK